MSAASSVPRTPLLLGLAGLLPFLAGAGTLLVGNPLLGLLDARSALILYAMVILSFLGGPRWGVALGLPAGAAAPQYALAVVPALVAWVASVLPRPLDAIVLVVALLALGGADLVSSRRGLWPAWYGRLRIGLAIVAAACVAVAVLPS